MLGDSRTTTSKSSMSTKFALGPDSSDKKIHVSLVSFIGVAFTGAICPVAASVILGGVELPDEI